MSDERYMIPWSPQAPTKMAEQIDEAVMLLSKMAPKGFDVGEFGVRTALQFINSPKLYQCKPESIIKSLMNCAASGLTMGDECSLIAFGDECTLMVEFQGWMRKFAEMPGYKRCVTSVVREGEEFEYDPIEGTIQHRPNANARNGKIIYAYCLIEFQDGVRWFEVLDDSDIERHKRRSRGGNSGPWTTDLKEMARKSAVHALAARYMGHIKGIMQVAQIADDAAQIEYQNTAPDSDVVEGYKDDLFGERQDVPRQESVVADLPPTREPKIWDAETGEIVDTAPQPEAEPERLGLSFDDAQERLRLRADLEQAMDMKQMPPRARARFINECGGGDTSWPILKDMAVLRAMWARVQAAEKGQEEAQTELGVTDRAQ